MTCADRSVKCEATWVYFFYSDRIEHIRMDISNPDDFWGFTNACKASGWSINFIDTRETALAVKVGRPWSENISAMNVFGQIWGVERI